MISVRRRKYKYFVMDSHSHEVMKGWKIESRHETLPLPGGLYPLLLEALNNHFTGFDILTVPAPSFHDYDKNYPIWEVAGQVSRDFGLKLEKLFPERSGKTKMFTFGSLEKPVQDIKIGPGLFVLILDDMATTGHTARVSCEAVARRGSFPCFLSIG